MCGVLAHLRCVQSIGTNYCEVLREYYKSRTLIPSGATTTISRVVGFGVRRKVFCVLLTFVGKYKIDEMLHEVHKETISPYNKLKIKWQQFVKAKKDLERYPWNE